MKGRTSLRRPKSAPKAGKFTTSQHVWHDSNDPKEKRLVIVCSQVGDRVICFRKSMTYDESILVPVALGGLGFEVYEAGTGKIILDVQPIESSNRSDIQDLGGPNAKTQG